MKKNLWLVMLCLFTPFVAQTVEFEVQFENEEIRVYRFKIEAGEEIGLHRNEYPRVIFAIQGGTITRFEQDGSVNHVICPTGKSFFVEADPKDQFHCSLNSSENAIEAIVFEMKKSTAL